MVLRLTLAVVLLAVTCLGDAAAVPIDIGSRLELFVDDYLIDTLDGARRVLHNPTR